MADVPQGPGVVVGGGGVGLALAHRMVADGRFPTVVLLSRSRPAGWDDAPGQAWTPADVLDEASLAAAAAVVRSFGAPTRIVVATGVLHGDGLAPEKSMRALDAAALTRVFQVNAVGPALAAKHLLPLTPRDAPSVFAALSARVGSIGDNHLGGWYGYRASKAALNMLIRTLAVEHRRTRPLGVCVALHPGTVDTNLSAPFQGGVSAEKLFSPQVSARALHGVIDGLGPDANGRFYAWDGAEIPW